MYEIFKAKYTNQERGFSIFAIELADDMVCIHHISGKIPYCSDLLNAMYQMDLHKKYINRKKEYSVSINKGLTGHRYLELRSYIGVYKTDPSLMETTETFVYGRVPKGAGLYEVKSKIEFNSSGKIDPAFIGINVSYWISDILEFMLAGVNIFGSIEAEIDKVDTPYQYCPIIDSKYMNSDIIEQKIRDLLFEESEDNEEDDIEDNEESDEE